MANISTVVSSSLANWTAGLTSTATNNQTFWLFIHLVICCVGIITNCMLLLAVLKDRSTSSGTRLMISTMVFTEILVSAVFYPTQSIIGATPSLWSITGVQHATCSTYIGVLWCFRTHSLVDVSLALNRSISVCFPNKFLAWQSTRASVLMILSSGAVASVIVILPVFEVGATHKLRADMRCVTIPHNRFTGVLYTYPTPATYCLVGLLSVVVFGAAAYKKLQFRRSPSSLSLQFAYRNLQKQLITVKAMVYVLILNFVTFLPYPVVHSTLSHVPENYPSLEHFLKILVTLHYALDPLVFFAVSRFYRRSLRRLWCRFRGSQVHPRRAAVPVVASNIVQRPTG